jgi:hypothetical protein
LHEVDDPAAIDNTHRRWTNQRKAETRSFRPQQSNHLSQTSLILLLLLTPSLGKLISPRNTCRFRLLRNVVLLIPGLRPSLRHRRK